MSVQRVPQVPFAQIANEALRDRRLSFKARGLLALVLSHSGEWVATARWLESQSDKDGRSSVQAALNELTNLGYRTVTRERYGADIRTVATWRHAPQTLISRATENLTVRKSDGQETGVSLEHYSKEHYKEQEHNQKQSFATGNALAASKSSIDPMDPFTHCSAVAPSNGPLEPDFDAFWAVYPRREAKAAARKAFSKAVKTVDPDEIIAGAIRYRSDPNREDQYTAHAATWLNAERWTDDPLPVKARNATGGDNRMNNYEALYNALSTGREIEA
jgi:hypothetical protein